MANLFNSIFNSPNPNGENKPQVAEPIREETQQPAVNEDVRQPTIPQSSAQPSEAQSPTPSDEPKPAVEEKPAQESQPSAEDKKEDYSRFISALTAIEKRLTALTHVVDNKLEEREERYQRVMQAAQEDASKKDKIKLIKRLIMNQGFIRDMLADFRKSEQSAEEKAAYLEQQIEAILKMNDAILQPEMITMQVSPKGTDFNDQTMNIVGTEFTQDGALNGKVARSVKPGYAWTLPYILRGAINTQGEEIKSYRFMIQDEEVVIYKLN